MSHLVGSAVESGPGPAGESFLAVVPVSVSGSQAAPISGIAARLPYPASTCISLLLTSHGCVDNFSDDKLDCSTAGLAAAWQHPMLLCSLAPDICWLTAADSGA